MKHLFPTFHSHKPIDKILILLIILVGCAIVVSLLFGTNELAQKMYSTSGATQAQPASSTIQTVPRQNLTDAQKLDMLKRLSATAATDTAQTVTLKRAAMTQIQQAHTTSATPALTPEQRTAIMQKLQSQ